MAAEASKRPEIGRLSTTFQPITPQLNVKLDRDKARAVGVKVDSVFQTLQAYLSGLYVNDIVRFGRVFKVFLQAEPEFTHQPDQIGNFYVRNDDGKMVPLDTLVDVEQISGPNFLSRFNLYLAAEIMGTPAPGYSSAQALSAIEEVAKTMPREFGYEWSGLTLQQKKSEGEAGVIFGMAIVFVFLLLAAQYGSWALRFAVLLCTPLVVLGTFIGSATRNFDNNVYAQIGVVMLIGLAAKNAILIVEFAKLRREEGNSLVESRARRRETAPAADPDDFIRVDPWLCTTAACNWFRRRLARCYGHRGCVWYDHCDAGRHFPHPGLLCLRSTPC